MKLGQAELLERKTLSSRITESIEHLERLQELLFVVLDAQDRQIMIPEDQETVMSALDENICDLAISYGDALDSHARTASDMLYYATQTGLLRADLEKCQEVLTTLIMPTAGDDINSAVKAMIQAQSFGRTELNEQTLETNIVFRDADDLAEGVLYAISLYNNGIVNAML